MLRHKFILKLVSEIGATNPERVTPQDDANFAEGNERLKAPVEMRLPLHTIDKSDVRPGICPYEGVVHTVLRALSPRQGPG